MPENGLKTLLPWRLLDRRLLLSAAPWLSVYQERVELPTGRVIEDFYRIVLPDFALVVPVTESGEVVLVRGYKHGLGRVTLSPPAGLVGAGESPLAAARRELLEETGYEAAEWDALGSYVVDGNRQCGTAHVFLARGARRTRPPRDDETEELEVELLTAQRLRQCVREGRIGNLAGVSAVALALVQGW
jgi:ADP-ribose pyrophosphatase